MNGCFRIFGLRLLNDLPLRRGSNYSALAVLMLGTEASACAGFNEYLVLFHRLSGE